MTVDVARAVQEIGGLTLVRRMRGGEGAGAGRSRSPAEVGRY
jgi:hypothetical protein